MDFLKDIVKEIGDDYTKLAAEIDETELEIIIEKLKTTSPQLYAKLWSYKINSKKQEKDNGFS